MFRGSERAGEVSVGGARPSGGHAGPQRGGGAAGPAGEHLPAAPGRAVRSSGEPSPGERYAGLTAGQPSLKMLNAECFNYIDKYNMKYIITKHSINKLKQRTKQTIKPDERLIFIYYYYYYYYL